MEKSYLTKFSVILAWNLLFSSPICAQVFDTIAIKKVIIADSLYENEVYNEALDYYFEVEKYNFFPKSEIYDRIAKTYYLLGEKDKSLAFEIRSIESGKRYFHISFIQYDTVALDILALDSTGIYLEKLEYNMKFIDEADQFAVYKSFLDSLDYRKQLDQKERGKASTSDEWAKQKKNDLNNRQFLQGIIDSIGSWPGYLEVGKTGESAAFLIAQHSEDSLFQIIGLELMNKALITNNINPQHYAMLLDRYTLNVMEFQLFGTQVEMANKNGNVQSVAKKLYNKRFAETLRKYFLMPPLDIYLESMNMINNK